MVKPFCLRLLHQNILPVHKFLHNWETNLKYLTIWAICVRVNEAHSQVMGQKSKQSNHSSAEKKENIILSAFLSFSFLWFITISSEVSICVIPTMAKQASFLCVELFWVVSPAFAALTDCSFYFAAFYLNLHIYLYESIRSDKPSQLSEFHF